MHEWNVTKFFTNRRGKKVWFNEPSVKESKHPTKINPRYSKTFNTRAEAETAAKSISRSYDRGKK